MWVLLFSRCFSRRNQKEETASTGLENLMSVIRAYESNPPNGAFLFTLKAHEVERENADVLGSWSAHGGFLLCNPCIPICRQIYPLHLYQLARLCISQCLYVYLSVSPLTCTTKFSHSLTATLPHDSEDILCTAGT